MRKLLILACIAVIAGCGGGGGNSLPTLLVTSPDGKVTLTGPGDAVPAGTTLALASRLPTDYTPQIQGSAFVASAAVTGYASAFTKPLTISFTLTTAISPLTEVRLYRLVQQGGQDGWVDTGTVATASQNGLVWTATPIDDCDTYTLLK